AFFVYRCQGLSQINTLLHEQLEIATEVNQTLTSDVQRLTKEWQQARSQLLAKESEWKEEEQYFSLYYTKESNVLLSLWRQVLNFRHDFANLRSHTERELSSFKGCICNSIQNVTDAQIALVNRSQNIMLESEVDAALKVEGYDRRQIEITRLQERISELLDKHEDIQKLLEEKEKANSVLCNTIEKFNESITQASSKVQISTKESQQEKLISQYSKAIEDISQVLMDDGSTEISSIFPILSFSSSSNQEGLQNIPNVNMLQSIVNAVKKTLTKYRKQTEESNIKLSSLNEQTVMQQRTIEFLEDEREKMQQLNSQLSSQFESVNQRMQDFLNELKTADDSTSKHSSALETVIKSLNAQVDNLQIERNHLCSLQQELQSKVENLSEEKRTWKQTELTYISDLNRSTRKISELDAKLESIRRDHQTLQGNFHQINLDKELLEEEKTKFSEILSNLQNQCFDLQSCLRKLRDEESFVKDSLANLQNLSESLSLEKNDVSQALNKTLTELESLKCEQTRSKIEFEKTKMEMKLEIDKLQEECLQFESERDKLQKQLDSIEESKHDVEDEKSQITIRNNDLTNQVTKYSNQKKSIELELEQVREELKHQIELTETSNQENGSLTRTNAELSVKIESMENEISQLNEVISALKDEKNTLEKSLYTSQQHNIKLQEEKSDVGRELDNQRSSVNTLQVQIKDLQEYHERYVDDVAREKNDALLKIQQMEQEYQTSLKNERHQHNVDIDIISEEKEALRGRMVSAIDELFERHQKQQDELLSQHQEEIALLKKQITTLEREYDEKFFILKDDCKKIQKDFKQQINTLEHTIEHLKTKLTESEELYDILKEKYDKAEREHHTLVEENADILKRLKDEMNNLSVEHSKESKKFEDRIETLRQEKASLLEEIHHLELKLNNVESDKNKIAKELDDRNSYYESEKNSKTLLEDRISLIQNQLKDEQSLNQVINKSLDDCKNRLKAAQNENNELKKQIDEAQQKLNEKDISTVKLQSQNRELKNTLREVEKSRQDTKREVHNLKRNIFSLEKSHSTKEEEINELNMLHKREEEMQDSLKKEIVQLKQKVMESNASNEAASKELSATKLKLSDLEHKFRLQQEQHQALLQDCLSSEQNFSEHRVNLERSVADASREIHNLRSTLNFEEGKVLALESKVVKLDGAKREVENKLYSICLFLRSILGLGSDSGFMSVSSNLQSSPGPSHGASSEKLTEVSRSSLRDSPHRFNMSKNSYPAQLNLSDLDIDLLKSSLKDLVHKFNAVEKERDELKDVVAKIQREMGELNGEHSQCISKIYQLKRDLEDKKNVEKDLATKIANIHHCEEVIRTLEREKRRLTEKIGSVEFFSSSNSKEKENLLDKISELKNIELKLHEEISALHSAREEAEIRSSKCIQRFQSLEAEIELLKDINGSKEHELKLLEQKLDTANRKLKTSESQTKSMELTIDHLSNEIKKYSKSEQLLTEKVKTLSNSLSQTSSAQQNLYEELERKQKEVLKNQTELFKVQQTNEQFRTSVIEYKLKNESLRNEVEELGRNLIQTETTRQEQLEQIRKMQSLLLMSENQEKEAVQQVEELQKQKDILEERVRSLSSTLRSTKEGLEENEELCEQLKKEIANLKKSLDKIEKEKVRNSEMTAKSILERSSLGKSLRQMEIENQTLQQRVQNLQAQLTELEERHSLRMNEFLKSQTSESKLEENRLRTALRQAERQLEEKEKTYRRKVLGLEKQIAVLKSHLDNEQKRWQQYHQRSLTASANINYLHSVLSNSLQNVSDDPQKLISEAERLDMTTETELGASGISVMTPSKLQRANSYTQRTSTPKAKRKLDMSLKS
ncbi:rootletin, partial [Nephila pilipes]